MTHKARAGFQTKKSAGASAPRRDGFLVLLVVLSLPLLPILFVLCALEGMTRGGFSRTLGRGL